MRYRGKWLKSYRRAATSSDEFGRNAAPVVVTVYRQGANILPTLQSLQRSAKPPFLRYSSVNDRDGDENALTPRFTGWRATRLNMRVRNVGGALSVTTAAPLRVMCTGIIDAMAGTGGRLRRVRQSAGRYHLGRFTGHQRLRLFSGGRSDRRQALQHRAAVKYHHSANTAGGETRTAPTSSGGCPPICSNKYRSFATTTRCAGYQNPYFVPDDEWAFEFRKPLSTIPTSCNQRYYIASSSQNWGYLKPWNFL